MNQFWNSAGILVMTLVVASCASSVQRTNDLKAYHYNGQTFSKVELTIRKDTAEASSGIQGFDQERLRSTIKNHLKVKGLVNTETPNIVKVEITDIRVRSTFNAVMWGFMAGDDHIKGDVTLIGENAALSHSFQVSASYALGGVAGGMEQRMGWLYEEFAKVTVQEIMDNKP